MSQNIRIAIPAAAAVELFLFVSMLAASTTVLAQSGSNSTKFGVVCNNINGIQVPCPYSSAFKLGYTDGMVAAESDIAHCQFTHDTHHGYPLGHHTSNYRLGYANGYGDDMAMAANENGSVGNETCFPQSYPPFS